MHILFLTDNFPPEVNAPASRTFEHCKEWQRQGHRVTVVTCVPNFPKGRVFEGYRNKLWQSQHMDAIHVIRIWSYITANQGFLKRTLDYVSFLLPAVLASLFVRKPDIVIGTSPQFFTVCAAYLVSRIKRIPFVFELRDIWPESIKAVGAMQDSTAIRLLEKVEMFLYTHADRIVTVTRSFKRILSDRGIQSEKIDVVTNGVDTERFRKHCKDKALLEKFGLENKFVAGYIGTHGMAHGLETILSAAEIAQRQCDPMVFLLLGDGARKQWLLKQAESKGLTNVLFVDTVSKDQVVRYWSLLDISIIHLKKTRLFESVIPSKLFECMAMGIPIAHGVRGESAEIVKKDRIGLVFTPENPEELYACLSELMQDRAQYQELQRNCLTTAPKYCRVDLANRMLLILEETVLERA